MSYNSFAPYIQNIQSFIVKNISTIKKVCRIFQYPIFFNQTRDLLKIPGVGESDIRVSLLKGEIRNKILAQEITILQSDIDLLQFNNEQKLFLESAGINYGLTITNDQISGIVSGGSNYLIKEDIELIGIQDSNNRIFYTPDYFIEGDFEENQFHIEIFHNGRRMIRNIEYNIMESIGLETGYNQILFIAFSPLSSSIIRAKYTIRVN